MLRSIWKRSFIKHYLEELIDAKISTYTKEHIDATMQHCDDDYYRKRWFEITERLRTESVTIFLTSDIRMILYTDSILSKFIYFNTFETNEICFLQRFLTKDDIFLDIGAHVGLFSLYASPILGKGGKIFAFEPTNTTFARLQQNIALNSFSNITPINKALSNCDGSAQLQVTLDGHDAWNSLAKPSEGCVSKTEEVTVTKLDSFISEISQNEIHKIKFLKIDVEGWEIPVLEGGKEFLSSPVAPTLLVEFTEKNAQNAGYTCVQLYEMLISFGYDMYTYDKESNTLIPEPLRATYPYVNVIATKNLAEIEARIQ